MQHCSDISSAVLLAVSENLPSAIQSVLITRISSMLSQQSVIYLNIFCPSELCMTGIAFQGLLINCSSVTSCFPFQDVHFFSPSSWINHFVIFSSCQKVTRVRQESYLIKNPKTSYPQFWFFSIRVGNMELNSIKIWQENVPQIKYVKNIGGLCWFFG